MTTDHGLRAQIHPYLSYACRCHRCTLRRAGWLTTWIGAMARAMREPVDQLVCVDQVTCLALTATRLRFERGDHRIGARQ